jgi:hypothetical protein
MESALDGARRPNRPVYLPNDPAEARGRHVASHEGANELLTQGYATERHEENNTNIASAAGQRN